MPSQLKCSKLIGVQKPETEVDKLFAMRNKLITDYLVSEKIPDAQRIIISNTTDEKSAEFEKTLPVTVEFHVDE